MGILDHIETNSPKDSEGALLMDHQEIELMRIMLKR